MAPLRPAHEVYHRLRWGGDVDLDRVQVVVLDRVRGTRVLPFVAFDPKGPIPFSRVLAFRIDDEVVWDRQARIDRVLGSGATPGERLSPMAIAGRGPLRVLTYNVLFDRYDPEVVRTAERMDDLLATIRDAEADLVALQEIQLPFLRILLAQDWVRSTYACTDDGSGDTVRPYGQVLLSRWPLTDVEVMRLEGDKRHLWATVWLPDAPSNPVRVVVVHLSSDRHDDAPQRRQRQVEVLADALPPEGPALVLGDFNQAEPVALPLDDVWSVVRPDDPGFTYDPIRNALARAQSPTGRRRRIDRIFQRGFEPDSVELVGVTDAELPPSDHHGVLATMQLAQPATDTARMHAAVVLPLPPEVAAHLEPWRRRFDPNRWRWPPHVTLFHGPVDSTRLHGFVPGARQACARLATRSVTVSSVDVWRQGSRVLLVVRTDEHSTQGLRELRDALPEGPWPAEGRPLQPHVTVARLAGDDPSRIEALRQRLEALLPLTWQVDRVEVWARLDAGAMVPHARMELHGGRPWAPPSLASVLQLHGAVATPETTAEQGELIARVEALVGSAEVVGSRSVGAHLPESDLDLSVRHPGPLRARRQCQEHFGGRVVDGEVPTLRLQHPPTGLAEWVDLSFGEPGESGAVQDWAAIREIADQPLGPLPSAAGLPDMLQVLRFVRAWAAARQVHDPAWGFPGGLAYGIAVAATAGPGSVEEWVCRVLERLAASEPLFIGAAPPPSPEDEASVGPPPRIWTSGVPRRAVVRQILPCTSRILVEELERALVLAWDGRFDLAMEPLMALRRPMLWLHMEAGSPDALDHVVGWTRGRARSLIAALSGPSSLHTPRPWPRLLHSVRRKESQPLGCRFGVGIEGIPAADVQAATAHLGARWLHEQDRPPDGVLRFDTVPG
ncbi:MAG: DUF504 domain-containing protein [Myxococcales bacterium]|nr:DUF504 domain-containing protein [Myxococcales bacterium]